MQKGIVHEKYAHILDVLAISSNIAEKLLSFETVNP